MTIADHLAGTPYHTVFMMDDLLVGSKRAVLAGNTIYLSPAMVALIDEARADQKMLARLYRAIPLVRPVEMDSEQLSIFGFPPIDSGAPTQ